MLYITTTSNKTIAWELGDKHYPLSVENIDNIKAIMASGNELDLIEKTFCINYYLDDNYRITHPNDRKYTIPFIYNRSDIIWHGDIAKTIISNIIT